MRAISMNSNAIFVPAIVCIPPHMGAALNDEYTLSGGGHPLRERSPGKTSSNDNPIQTRHATANRRDLANNVKD